MQVTTIISSSSGSSLQLQPHVTIICNGVRHLVTSQAVLPPAPPPQPAVMVAAKLQPPLEGSTQRKHKFLDLDWESSKFRPSTRTGIEVGVSQLHHRCQHPDVCAVTVACRCLERTILVCHAAGHTNSARSHCGPWLVVDQRLSQSVQHVTCFLSVCCLL